MPSDLPRVYFDACVFIDFIANHPERARTIGGFLELSLKNEIDIVTSTASIVEVSHILSEKESRKIDPNIEAKIDAMFNDDRVIKLIDFSPVIARDARFLVRDSIASPTNILKPLDAVHLASAERLKVREFLTYDKKILLHNGRFSFPIHIPFSERQSLF